LPDLKALAKEGIRKSISRANVIQELFSAFTSKSVTNAVQWRTFTFLTTSFIRYQEIIEVEVDFLVKNFSGTVRRDFDDMLQMIVVGTQTHCFRALAFTMRRLLGEDTPSAWAALNHTEGRGGRDGTPNLGPVTAPLMPINIKEKDVQEADDFFIPSKRGKKGKTNRLNTPAPGPIPDYPPTPAPMDFDYAQSRDYLEEKHEQAPVWDLDD
jgi:hypothetical protein